MRGIWHASEFYELGWIRVGENNHNSVFVGCTPVEDCFKFLLFHLGGRNLFYKVSWGLSLWDVMVTCNLVIQVTAHTENWLVLLLKAHVWDSIHPFFSLFGPFNLLLPEKIHCLSSKSSHDGSLSTAMEVTVTFLGLGDKWIFLKIQKMDAENGAPLEDWGNQRETDMLARDPFTFGSVLFSGVSKT